MKKLNKPELIELVKQILNPNNGDIKRSKLLEFLEENVSHPAISDLIFWPQDNDLGLNPTIEEIVDKALSYKPIQL